MAIRQNVCTPTTLLRESMRVLGSA
jgi:hypothetical protein